jgi:predicted RNA-binding protein
MADINHYILRVGDGENFINGFAKHLWAVKDSHKSFLEKVKQGDKLWFIRSKTSEDLYSGKIIAVVDFQSKNERIIGPLKYIILIYIISLGKNYTNLYN